MELTKIQPKIKDLPEVTPINQESRFNFDELFFSVTDKKSNILFANDVFVRISKYKEEEILGQLHKVIRHPDMPRSVFKIFWDHLKANKPVAAYVKNMAKDGSYYWVMALAFPCDAGYLSIRLKPSCQIFDKVRKIYAETLKLEKQREIGGDKKKAMQAGEEHLLSLLKEEGFACYDDFMWNALQGEMKSREDQISKNHYDNYEHATEEFKTLAELDGYLSNLVCSLVSLKSVYESISGHSGYILALAKSIVRLSLNAQVNSSKLTDTDQSLSVIAEKMGEQSILGESNLVDLKNIIEKFSDITGTLNFDIVSAKLQVEMTLEFIRELKDNSNKYDNAELKPEEAKKILYSAFEPRLKTICDGLIKIPEYMQGLLTGVKVIERFLMTLRFIHITGKVEVSRMASNSAFATTFQSLLEEINTAEGHLNELSDSIVSHKHVVEKFRERHSDLTQILKNLNISLKQEQH
ncbi:PAS domain-containing protein [Gracilimonas mengyeensis]|uniref:Aerotaxis receptor n=1 Tax=Gracilimonas mengyeensis TaxID=1302730 RepID=A0A521AQ02_9BACT|nr:PAS domain-containing protein [Gracilimonas mengyeensis]SMO36720.1 aerotaxis receptor [Gracilimonas mengyeensis]